MDYESFKNLKSMSTRELSEKKGKNVGAILFTLNQAPDE